MAVRATQLDQDLLQFADGDQTMLGESGDTLSGGQQKRINLARAVYRDSDVYLLDDVLASLDIKVATMIFEQCLLGMLHGKTRILFANTLTHLQGVDRIYLVREGQIATSGTYAQVRSYLKKENRSLLFADEQVRIVFCQIESVSKIVYLIKIILFNLSFRMQLMNQKELTNLCQTIINNKNKVFLYNNKKQRQLRASQYSGKPHNQFTVRKQSLKKTTC